MVFAPRRFAAFERAPWLLVAAAAQAGLPEGPIVRAEAISEDEDEAFDR